MLSPALCAVERTETIQLERRDLSIMNLWSTLEPVKKSPVASRIYWLCFNFSKLVSPCRGSGSRGMFPITCLKNLRSAGKLKLKVINRDKPGTATAQWSM